MKRDSTWCKHHKPSRHESQISPRLVRDVRWYRRERAKWLVVVAVRHRYPKTPLPLDGEPVAQWLARHRLTLTDPTCAVCGTTEELEFDHDEPRDWIANKTSRWQRLRLYIRDIKAGKVKHLLCRVHNAQKGRPEGGDEEPF